MILVFILSFILTFAFLFIALIWKAIKERKKAK